MELGTYQRNTPNATTDFDSEHPFLHSPVPFQFATAAKALNHSIANTRSVPAIAYGFANFRVRGKRGVIVW